MNFQYKKFLQRITVACITTVIFADTDNNTVVPYLQHKSSDLISKVVGMNQHNHLFGLGSNYGTFDLDFKYNQSWRPKDITRLLWGPAAVSNTTTTGTTTTTGATVDLDDNDLVVNVSSGLLQRNSTDLDALQFELPTDYESTLIFKPRSQQFRLGAGFYMAFDEVLEGLFMRIRGDFVHTRHNLEFNEIKTAGTASTTTLASFASFASGTSLTTTNDGSSFQGLQYAKFDTESKTVNEFGDLYLEVGYNALLDEDYHFGFSGLFIAPTGKKPNAEYLWEPRGTNGGHFGLGGSVTGHYTLWRSEDEEKHFDIVIDAEFTHLFNAKQVRTFDLKTKPLSRYALANKMQPNDGSLTAGDTANSSNAKPALQFAKIYAPVANISTQRVTSHFGIEGTLVGMFTFVCRGWSWDLGYNFYGLSSEKLSLRNDSDDATPAFAANTWALAGDLSPIGFNSSTPISLSSTASGSTVFNGVVTIDTPKNAFASDGTTKLTTEASGSTQATTSLTPVTIAVTDLDLEGAQTRIISHAVFTHVNYTWIDREEWVPFVGFGAKIELGHRLGKNETTTTTTPTTTTDSSTLNTALSQWGVFLKGGVSFN